MEVIAAATIWAMFVCFLLFPIMGLPAVLHRTAMAILLAELFALMLWSYGAIEVGRVAAGIDIPLLALALMLATVAYGLRRHARSHEDPREPR